MPAFVTKLLSSNFINNGLIGKIKDYIYYHYYSKHMEAQTDHYRKEILDDLRDAFGDSDWILASGSFLRYYRDKTMDGQDLDILIRYEDFQKAKKLLMEKGYALLAEYTNDLGQVNEYKLKYKKADIDIIFVFHDEQGWYYIGTYENPNEKNNIIREVVGDKRIVYGDGYRTYKKYIPDFEVSEYEFHGMKFKSYKNADAHLAAEYGNWQIYDPNYNWLSCPPNNAPQRSRRANLVYYCHPLEKF